MTDARRCAIYARISVTKDESVSIERTIEACEQYAAAYGWQVVGVFTDDGVSASDSRPEARAGWRALTEAGGFDTVIVWKVDRLARRLTDFWSTYASLAERAISLVSVEERLDMTTALGRTVAGIIAGFAEHEAETISLRTAQARQHLLRSGRAVGGKVPYGWRNVPNPDGPGLVLAQDPDTVGYVCGMVERARRGDTVYSVKQWLDEVGAPTPAGRPGPWRYASVERILRHPVLAGMTPFNPGRTDERTRGDDVLRDADGLPLVDPALAVMGVAEWRAMVDALDGRTSAQSRPRAMRSATSPLLSGLVRCGRHDEPVRMHRGTLQGREAYKCPRCHQSISAFEDVVVDAFLEAKGERLRWRRVEVVHTGGAAALPEIERRLDELDGLIRTAPGRDARAALQAEQGRLLDLRDERRAETPTVEYRWEGTDQTFAEDWADAGDDPVARRAVLDDGLASVTVAPGAPGRRTREKVLARLTFKWVGEVGPQPVPDESWIPDTVLRA